MTKLCPKDRVFNRFCSMKSAFVYTTLLFANQSSAQEPGNVDREGVTVFKAVAPEQSEYFVSGTENLYPPLNFDHQWVDGLSGSSINLRVNDIWDLSHLGGYQEGTDFVYDDFLSAVLINGAPTINWPLLTGTTDHDAYLGVHTFSELFGSYLSRAYFSKFGWHADNTPYPGSSDGFGFFGFPRVGSPQDVQVPPSYPPITHDIGMSNSPLVPASVAGTTRAIYSVRETLDGQLDLITGQPLIREVDLEIPFGGAVFRRIRTYSEAPSTGQLIHNWYDKGSWQRSRTPGWHGSGWMSSEAPLFLIDASIAQTMTTPDNLAPRCIFAPDAQHAIPFIQQVSPAIGQSGNTTNGYVVDYIAPEWFDAILLHSEDGEWDPTNNTWEVPPSEFRVILNKRSITYIIKPYYEDVDPAEHRKPTVDNDIFNSGATTEFGVPYYGLVTEVRDRAGNRIKYTYASKHQPFDGPIYEQWNVADPQNPLLENRYLSVRQHGWYKGMIDHIKLYPAGESEAAWTLLYTYRAFAAQREKVKQWNFWDQRSFPPALHSILAYEEDLNVQAIPRDLILKCHDIPDTSTCEQDPPDPSSTDWTIDASDLDINPDGHSSTDIDSEPWTDDSNIERAIGDSSPPFSELMLHDPTEPCNTRMVPVPLKSAYANQFDYQDGAIGPAGEGDDPSTWSVIPSNWAKQVRYSYADPPQYTTNVGPSDPSYTVLDDYTAKSAGPVEFPTSSAADTYWQQEGDRMAYLLKVRSIERDEDPNAAPVVAGAPLGIERYWLYRYQDAEGPRSTTPDRFGQHWDDWSDWHDPSGNEIPRRLVYRYTPRAVDSLAASSIWSTQSGIDSKNEYINHLVGLDEFELIPTLSGEDESLFRLAETSYLRWSEPYHLAGVHDGGSSSASTFGEPGSSTSIAYAGSWAAFDGELRNSGASTPSVFQEDMRDHYLGAVVSDACPDLKISQADEVRTGFLPEGTSIYVATDSQGNRRWYRLYRFLTAPSSAPGEAELELSWRGYDSQSNSVGGHDPQSNFYRGPELFLPSNEAPGATQALYHYPYKFAISNSNWYDASNATGYGQHQRKDPMWWVVVDEYDSLDEALSVNSSLTHADPGTDGWSSDFYTGQDDWVTRRVVALNSAGLVLSDRTWDDAGDVDAPPAILEAYVYDDYMRTEMKLSRGWGSEIANRQDSSNPNNISYDEGVNGLVEIYTYDDRIETPILDENGDPVLDPDTNEPLIDIEIPRVVKGLWLNKGCVTPETDPGELHVSESLYYRDIFPDAPEYIRDQMYSQVVFDLQGAPGLGTIHHRVKYWGAPDPQIASPEEVDAFNAENPPVEWDLSVGAVFKRDPTGQDLHPVNISFYNRESQLVWQVSGSMKNIIDLNYIGAMNDDISFVVEPNIDELFLNYRQYDDEGRQFISVEDIDVPSSYTANAEPGFNINDLRYPPSGGQQQWPINETQPHGTLFLISQEHAQLDQLDENLTEFWSQLSDDMVLLNSLYRQAEASPLDLVTYQEFSRFGPSKVVHPTGVRDLYDYSLESDYLNELKAMGVEFDGESWGFAGQQLYDSNFDGNQFVEQIQSVMEDLLAGQWDGNPYTLNSNIFNDYRLQVISEVTPNYDSAGRLASMRVSDEQSDAEPIEQFVAYDGWGNIVRSQDADGAIDRITYDKFGRTHKTFKGSRDRHEIWGTADIGQDNDDMFLVEKVHYGLGTNDAGMVTHKWMFRERSGDENDDRQYGIDWDEESESDRANNASVFASIYQAGGSSATQTSSGTLEEYEYDWRMRKVITRYSGLDTAQGNTSVYREERVFLDNAGRTRFVAVYDGLATAAPSPDLDPGTDLPPASAFYLNGASSNLLSLNETVYNGAGQTVETRQYDPDSVDQNNPGFLVTHNFTDHANKPTWSRDSGQRITKNVYDAKGRLAWSSVWAGDIELSRTVNAYGPADTVDMMLVFERIDTSGMAGTLNTLDPVSGSVDMRVKLIHQWFDSNKRLIAVADFGETDYNGSIASYQTPLRPATAPLIFTDLPGVPPNGATPGEVPKLLVGFEYPSDWLDTDGRGTARVDAYWYGSLGKKNAVLRMLNVEPDGQAHTRFEYTIDRYEYNNYGQKILEHSYGFDISNPSDPNSGLPYLLPDSYTTYSEFIGGAVFNYEVEGYDDDPFDGIDPPVFASTKVREITPLTAGHVLTYSPEKRRYEVDWVSSTDPVRKTILEYNAPIVEPNFVLPSSVLHPVAGNPYVFPIDSNDWGHLGVSNRPDLVKAVHIPNPSGGWTGDGTGYSFFYFYYADGLPAIRLDSRGIAIYYIYDERGNLTKLACDDTNLPLADLGLIDDQLPANYIEYEYDAIDRLVLLTTGRENESASYLRVETQSQIDYDAMGNMLVEYQSRDGNVNTSTTPKVEYEWERVYAQTDYSSGLATRDNINRLEKMIYPDRTGTYDGGTHSPRELTYEYGADGSISDLLSRVKTITSSGGPTSLPIEHIAEYNYSGINRLESVMLGTPSAEPQGSTENILRDVRSFDLIGRVSNRTVSAFNGSGTYRDVQVSDFGYDVGNRRIFERLTQQDTDANVTRDNIHSSFYDYDLKNRLVGEHYGSLHTDGFEGIDQSASTLNLMEMTYGLDLLNRRVGIGSAPGIWVWDDTDTDGIQDAGELLSQTHIIDARGGLTGLDDGTAVETVDQDVAGAITHLHNTKVYYDWLGRPVLIKESDETPIAAYRYDGFGRLAKRIALWPSGKTTQYREEIYYYDGVRRIQEVFTDPIDAIPPWTVDPGDVPLYTGGNSHRTEAEFIWSAASGQPFDTCHVQIDWWDREAWYIQDHVTGTVRAFVDAYGEMVRQQRFDAFGNLKNEDAFALAGSGQLFQGFNQRLGHQGLFAERVDTDTLQIPLELGGEVWYQNRSRWYVPKLGRFLTSDPNETGIPTQQSLAMLGRTPTGPPSGSFGWESHYGDGWDTFAAYGANPMMSQDPTGLFFLVDTITGQLARTAGKAYGFYDKADPAIGFAKNILGGISFQQAVLMAAADLVFDKAGGKVFDRLISSASKLKKINGRLPINGDFAGKRFLLPDDLATKYPSGVYFKPSGFPDFTQYATKQKMIMNLTGDRASDYRKANAAFDLNITPIGYTWHHVEDGVTMQLIPTDLHRAIPHTGGVAKLKELGVFGD